MHDKCDRRNRYRRDADTTKNEGYRLACRHEWNHRLRFVVSADVLARLQLRLGMPSLLIYSG